MFTEPKIQRDFRADEHFISGGVWNHFRKYLSPDGDVAVYSVEFVHKYDQRLNHIQLRFVRNGFLYSMKGEVHCFKKDLDAAIKYAKRLERVPANKRRSVAAAELYAAPQPERETVFPS